MGMFGEKFEGVSLIGDKIFYKSTRGPVKGAVARVEQGADIQRRVSLGRMAATGLLALRHKKLTGHVFLTIEGDGFDIAVEVPAKKEADARKFAAKVNTAGKR